MAQKEAQARHRTPRHRTTPPHHLAPRHLLPSPPRQAATAHAKMTATAKEHTEALEVLQAAETNRDQKIVETETALTALLRKMGRHEQLHEGAFQMLHCLHARFHALTQRGGASEKAVAALQAKITETVLGMEERQREFENAQNMRERDIAKASRPHALLTTARGHTTARTAHRAFDSLHSASTRWRGSRPRRPRRCATTWSLYWSRCARTSASASG
jgi:hypothetical protein